jgi:hypothetical protein
MLKYDTAILWVRCPVKVSADLTSVFLHQVNLLISIMPSDTVSSFMVFLNLVLNWPLSPERYRMGDFTIIKFL